MDFEGQTFTGDTLTLDGSRYTACTFDGVTFEYAGGDFFFDACTFKTFPRWTFRGDLERGLVNLATIFNEAGQLETLATALGNYVRSIR